MNRRRVTQERFCREILGRRLLGPLFKEPLNSFRIVRRFVWNPFGITQCIRECERSSVELQLVEHARQPLESLQLPQISTKQQHSKDRVKLNLPFSQAIGRKALAG